MMQVISREMLGEGDSDEDDEGGSDDEESEDEEEDEEQPQAWPQGSHISLVSLGHISPHCHCVSCIATSILLFGPPQCPD
jgi:hypothetical protein